MCMMNGTLQITKMCMMNGTLQITILIFESFKNGRSVTRIIHINSLDVLWF